MTPSTDKDNFNAGEMAIIEKTAWRVGDAVADRLKEDFKIIVELHEAKCPLGVKLEELKNGIEKERAARRGFLRGVAVLAALVGGAFAFIVTKIVEHVFK